MDCYMGIDLGTSGVKTILLDGDGHMVAEAGVEQTLKTPSDGWAEQEPEIWWENTKQAMRKVLSLSGGYTLRSIGLTGQMLGATFLDKERHSIRPCLIWCDQRSALERDELEQTLGMDKVMRTTGNYMLTGYWLPKLKWLEIHEPDHYSRIDKLVFPKDYIRFKLTGELVTEVSDGGGSSLFDVNARDWSWEMIDDMGFPRSWFPSVVESDEITGEVLTDVAQELGILPGIPVVAGAGDQPAGGIGNGICEEGYVSSTIGTSGVVFACTDALKVDTKKRGIHSFCHAARDKWSVFGCTLAAGGSFKWMREHLAGEESRYAQASGVHVYDAMGLLASRSPTGSRGLLFLPYMIGERTPYPDPYAKGVFFGLSLRHNRADMIRSAMEGVAFSLRDSMEILREFGVDIRQVRASGGGGKSPLWRQIQADVFNAEVITLNYDEGPALGAAILSMVGTGRYSSVAEACGHIIYPVQRCEPVAKNVMIYEELYGIYTDLYPALKSTYARHAQIQALKL